MPLIKVILEYGDLAVISFLMDRHASLTVTNPKDSKTAKDYVDRFGKSAWNERRFRREKEPRLEQT